MTDITTIIFDLGAVLTDWNPHYLYETIFEQEAERHHFFQTVCTAEWNEEQDEDDHYTKRPNFWLLNFRTMKRPFERFNGRYPEMLRGPITGTLDILRELKASGQYGLYALTNWSAETFPVALEQFEFLSWFDGLSCRALEKDRKPFASFYNTLLRRYDLNPGGMSVYRR